MIKTDLKQFAGLFSDYTELRFQENRVNYIAMVDGTVMRNTKSTTRGSSARVYHKGCWGFASNPIFNEESVKQVIDEATLNAKFLSSKNQDEFNPLPESNGADAKDFSTDKKRITQKELIGFMQNLDEYIVENCKKIKSRNVIFSCLDMEKNVLTSTGSTAYSNTPRTLMIISLTVEEDGNPYNLYEVFGDLGQFEDVFENPEDLYPGIDKLYTQLVDKSVGVYAEAGIKDVIMDADLAGILAHEAIGHTTEADLVIGGSVAADYLNKKVGTELVTLIDYAHTAHGKQCPVPVYVDDEGTPAEDCVIIENGILKKFMSNKETASKLDIELTGNARAYAFYDEPLVRMRNTALVPGTSKLDDMIASIEDGYYLIKSSNGQADSTSEFMFGVVMGYEIKNGKLGKAIKDLTISGVAFDVLKTVTMVSDDMVWGCGGMCGKKQSIPVGMGGPAIKCKVNIGGK